MLAFLSAFAGTVTTGSGVTALEPPVTDPSMFVPVQPCRLLDTRESNSRLTAGSTIDVDVVGRCDVAAGAVAAAVTLTAVAPNSAGHLTASPAGSPRPETSALNYRSGDVIANQQFIRLGASGGLSVYSVASVDLVVDVSGYFAPAESSAVRAGRFVPVSPRRLLDTRETARPVAGATVVVDPGVEGAIAVAVTVTTADTWAPGFFTAFPAGAQRPLSSMLNADRAGQVRAATAVVPVGPGGIAVYTSAANHVIVDITGYFTGPDAPASADGLFRGINPSRLVDTRGPRGASGGPRLWDHGTREFGVGGFAPGSSAIAVNVTMTETEDAGHVTAYPARTAFPATSTLNAERAQQTVANLALVGVSEYGVALHAYEATEVVVDVLGFFTGPPMAATTGPARNDPPADRQVTIISDSAMAGIRWNGAYGGLLGFNAVPKLESCRRLVQWSCRGREGYVPPTAVAEIDALPHAGPEEMLVIAVGYNDWHERFSSDFDAVIDVARRKGFRHIAWVDFRSDVGYRLPSSGGAVSNYGEMNRLLGEKLASGAFPEVRRWRFDDYTRGAADWFASDGVHETRLGSWGVADWLSRHIRAFDDRPCAVPWTVGGAIDDPCPNPDDAALFRGRPDIASLYGVG